MPAVTTHGVPHAMSDAVPYVLFLLMLRLLDLCPVMLCPLMQVAPEQCLSRHYNESRRS